MRTYWLYQAFGWLTYSAIGITINVLSGGHLRSLIINHILFIGCSIGLTHLFRGEIKKRRSVFRSIHQMWPFLMTGVLLISIVQTSLIILTSIMRSGHSGQWTPTSVVALWWGMILATSIWTILYIRFTEKRIDAAREDQLHLALREAKLHVLESQVNPHFLFNCLNSIRALVEIDPPHAQDMLTRLANVLRHSLHHDRQHTVSLASEIEVVADYLALEAIRFEERLQVNIAIDPDTAHCLVPPMLLQTLVENSIKHGISQLTGAGELIVKADYQDGFLRLIVENTGHMTNSPVKANLGLSNSQQRLHLLYGEAANLSLKEISGRVIATVLIPSVS